MLLDWFTVGAQVVNFLVLVWLMKRFLYGPILRAIDAREARIAAELADADTKKAEARTERDDFQRRNEAFDAQRSEMLKQASEEANTERHRLIDAARQAADDLSTKRREVLKREEQRLKEEIARCTREEVFAIARKTLTDLAEATLEARMIEVFLRRLHDLDGEAKKLLSTGLKATLNTSADTVIVRSAFPLSQEQCAAIQQALNETASAEIGVDFRTAPELVCGIELTASGQKLAWSIADYLSSMDQSIGELLKGQTSPESSAEGVPQAAASGNLE